ncbi:MAG: NAD(P)H-hydrate epimerase [Thermoproteota archaeon]|nr:NAD(P)H-hydrate epimerase [Thermoproteota archaeon]
MSKNKNGFQKGFEPITSKQMYQIEDNGEKIYGMKKLMMMENAGSKISDFLMNYYKDNIRNKKIVSICGLGNNGGDAIVANRHLSGYLSSKFPTDSNNLVLVLLGNPDQLKTEESKTNWNIVEKINAIKKIVFNTENIKDIEMEIEGSDIIIDGLFGTGIKGTIKDPFSKIIDKINQQKTKSFILSVDIPSGVNPDTGDIIDKSIKADTTITFHRIKQGLLNNLEYSGEIVPVKIGIPNEAEMGVI